MKRKQEATEHDREKMHAELTKATMELQRTNSLLQTTKNDLTEFQKTFATKTHDEAVIELRHLTPQRPQAVRHAATKHDLQGNCCRYRKRSAQCGSVAASLAPQAGPHQGTRHRSLPPAILTNVCGAREIGDYGLAPSSKKIGH